ncbi:MAG: NAD-dependent epimerase/dehydratase family protein [Candidatus Heimdallarchaeota archaeon]|nr:NAD-dependent epimerase/dehydratase family protein [Candidatus Heimdallarchaeota archaeon]MCK4768803.1 NAD-dependent epimerase/dehydratase family protein [Candidatus Heimdallarchaeota archaeon]
MSEKKEKTNNYPLKNLGKCLVIGGAGMLGFEIVLQLKKEGYFVRILDLEPVDLEGVESLVGDIRNLDVVEEACEGMDTVFQTAAAIWDPGTPKRVYDEVNVIGNQNVIDTCIKFGIPRFVYTSTLDVVVDGKEPIIYADESLPYPKKLPKDNYSRTKILAEKATIEANNEDGLLTVSLRPVGMYGPRDKYHIANIIQVAQSKNNIKLGDGTAEFSHVYSENAAYAHILAAKHLYSGSKVPGECYFIADHQPADNLFVFMKPFLEALNLPVPEKSIPYKIAYFLAWFAEKFAPKSNFNRFAVIQTCVDHTFVSDKAERDFSYKPIVSKEEAFEKTVDWFKNESGIV